MVLKAPIDKEKRDYNNELQGAKIADAVIDNELAIPSPIIQEHLTIEGKEDKLKTRKRQRLEKVAQLFDNENCPIEVKAETVVDGRTEKPRMSLEWASKETDFQNLKNLFDHLESMTTNAQWQQLLFGREFITRDPNLPENAAYKSPSDRFLAFIRKVELVLEQELGINATGELDGREAPDNYAQDVGELTPEERNAFNGGEIFRIVRESDFLRGMLNRKTLNFNSETNTWKPLAEQNNSTFVHAMWQLWSLNVEAKPEVEEWGELDPTADYLSWWDKNYTRIMPVFSIFHDFGKSVKPGYLDHGLLSAEVARDFFEYQRSRGKDYGDKFIDRVTFLVEHHHIFYYLTKELTTEGATVKSELIKSVDQGLALKLLHIIRKVTELSDKAGLNPDEALSREMVKNVLVSKGGSEDTAAFEVLGDNESLESYVYTLKNVLRADEFNNWEDLIEDIDFVDIQKQKKQLAQKYQTEGTIKTDFEIEKELMAAVIKNMDEQPRLELQRLAKRVAERVIADFYIHSLTDRMKKQMSEGAEEISVDELANMPLDQMLTSVFMGKEASVNMMKDVDTILVEDPFQREGDLQDALIMSQAVLEKIKEDPYMLFALSHFTMSDVFSAGHFDVLIPENFMFISLLMAAYGIKEK